MQPYEQLAVILPALTTIVDQLEPDDLDQPTPCADFTVRGVLDHLFAGSAALVPAFRGEASIAGSPPPVINGWVPAAEFHQAMTNLREAVNSPGALERTIVAPFGEVEGSVFARFVAFDALIHGYDIASSTGQPYDPPAEVVAAVDSFARATLSPETRAGDMFGPATEAPDGASVLEELVAFSGRTI